MIVRCIDCGELLLADLEHDEEQRKEYNRLYPGKSMDDAGIICHSCHLKKMRRRELQ